jgi:hypothetical protein
MNAYSQARRYFARRVTAFRYPLDRLTAAILNSSVYRLPLIPSPCIQHYGSGVSTIVVAIHEAHTSRLACMKLESKSNIALQIGYRFHISTYSTAICRQSPMTAVVARILPAQNA